MNNLPKNFLGLVSGFLLSILVLNSCESGSLIQLPSTRLAGKTMGTTYSIIIPEEFDNQKLQQAVDSLLLRINDEVSTYEPESLISQFNRGDTLMLPVVNDPNKLLSSRGAHLAANLILAVDPYEKSNGYFEPTIGPLTEYYGFGRAQSDTTAVEEAKVQELLTLVGFSKVVREKLPGDRLKVYAASPGVALDLSAIAKGYGVDQLAYLLQEKFKFKSYFIEIGGETRSAGHSPRGTPWTIAISTPEPSASQTDVQSVLAVSDISIATSGNYRNIRFHGGSQFVHTINPKTGVAKASTLLSATVLATTCAEADAYATACMASGENAPEVLAKAGLSACLIFAGADNGYDVRYIGDFEQYLLDQFKL